VLLGLQALAHVAMTFVPWALGLRVHHEGPLLTTPMVVAHIVAAVVLTLVVARAERLLAAALAVARAVGRLLRRATARARHSLLRPEPLRADRGAEPRRRPPCRGPPLLASTRT